MILEWHYPREDKNDLPKNGSTVLIAEYVRNKGIKNEEYYAFHRITMYEHFDPKILPYWAKFYTYAWAYFEIPPLTKGGKV